MTRGFTLLELLITMSVCAVVLTFAAPSFSTLVESSKMKRLAIELNGFMMQARSEAVMRNQTLFAHFSFAPNTTMTSNEWFIILTESEEIDSGEKIAYFNGRPFSSVSVRHTYTAQRVKFDGIRGRAKSGSIFFHPSTNSALQLAIKTSNPPGRVKVCAVQGDRFGYRTC